MYTTVELSKEIDVPVRRILSWIERGIVEKEANGHGSKRLWSEAEVVRLQIISRLDGVLSVDAMRSLLNRDLEFGESISFADNSVSVLVDW